MKPKTIIISFISLFFIFISHVKANETFSGKISNFYGMDMPLLPGDFSFVFADEIGIDGSFRSVEDFSNSQPNISIQGELRTGNLDAYISDANSISLNFAVLQDGSTENDYRKSFYACNVVRDATELVSTNIEVFNDNSFVENCSFIFPEFNFVSYNYNYCLGNCVEINYTFFITNLKNSDKNVVNELGIRIYDNLERAFNGDTYDFNFVETYLN